MFLHLDLLHSTSTDWYMIVSSQKLLGIETRSPAIKAYDFEKWRYKDRKKYDSILLLMMTITYNILTQYSA